MGRVPTPLRSLNGLRAFEAAARYRSFTKAAEELNVSQAAVSRIVKVLEERLEVPLFRRTANQLLLTQEGKELLPTLTSAFDTISDAISKVVESSRSKRHLTVGVGGTFALRWLIPRLARFQDIHPNLDLQVSIGNTTSYFDEDWTCGVRFQDGDWEGYEVEPLFAPNLIPVCAPAVAETLSHSADLKDATLLYVASALDDWPRWLGVDSVPEGRRLVVQTYAMALQAALDGVGVALTLCPYVVDDLRVGRLVSPFPRTVTKGRNWALIYRPFRKESGELVEFRQWLLDEITASESVAGFEFSLGQPA